MHFSQVTTPEQARAWLLGPVDVIPVTDAQKNVVGYRYHGVPIREYERIAKLAKSDV